MHWHDALQELVGRTPPSLCWMLIGSAATARHQVPLQPGDVDVLIHPATTDRQIQRLSDELEPFAGDPATLPGLEHFTSSRSAPWARVGDWTFGRWWMAGTKLEVARITSEVEPDSVNETAGEAVWAIREIVPWRGLKVPVVPLRVQLRSCRDRGLTERAAAIERQLAGTQRRPVHDRGPTHAD